jgi:DNA polymerase sigma
MGVANTNIFRYLFNLQPEAAKLCIFIRKWLNANDLNFKNFTVVLLVVFFLQQLRHLPSILTAIQRNNNQQVFIDGEF